MSAEVWTGKPKYSPTPCARLFRSDTYVPKFGDVIHCTNGFTSFANPCAESFMVLGSGIGRTPVIVDVMCLSRPGYVSVCHIGHGSSWHLAEAYAPEEE